MSNNSNPVIQALLLQKDLFGDELFLPASQLVLPASSAVYTASAPAAAAAEKKIDIEADIKPPAGAGEAIEIKQDTGAVELSPPAQNSGDAAINDFKKCTSIEELYNTIHDCTKCVLGSTRNKFVFGTGNPAAEVMLVGEGPGAEEDLRGEPFVGRAGQLLTDILKAINFTRDEVYIANIVKCRPPNNRTPAPEEMDACFPYLQKQIELIKPKQILCLGGTAALGILKRKESLGKLRQHVFDYNDIKVMVTYHPAALLRNPNWKRDCWEDVKAFKALYEKLTGKVK